MNDPIKCVQKVLDRIFSHLLFHIEQQFHRNFQCYPHRVHEAIERLKNAKVSDWGGSVAMDFADLYSNCNIKSQMVYIKH